MVLQLKNGLFMLDVSKVDHPRTSASAMAHLLTVKFKNSRLVSPRRKGKQIVMSPSVELQFQMCIGLRLLVLVDGMVLTTMYMIRDR